MGGSHISYKMSRKEHLIGADIIEAQMVPILLSLPGEHEQRGKMSGVGTPSALALGVARRREAAGTRGEKESAARSWREAE